MSRALQFLSVTQGSYARELIRSSREEGIAFDGAWEDLSRFIKRVNNGWGRDPGAGAGWFPPRVFEGVPRLHLPRTLTILAVATYQMEARAMEAEPLLEGGMPLDRHWVGVAPEMEGGAITIRELMYVHAPAPIHEGIRKALVDTYGLQTVRPEVQLGVLYALARIDGDLEGFSLPILIHGEQRLFLGQADLPSPEAAQAFFLEAFDAARAARHLERFYEMFNITETTNRRWSEACIRLVDRLRKA